MASKVRVRLNHSGFRALLTGPEITADLEERAERVAAAAGSGFGYYVDPGHTRARAAVVAQTWGARRREARDHLLLAALDAGR